MKKIFVSLFGISLLILNSGCFDILEEVFLNKDGSGKYLVTMDMSSMFTDPFMKGMMEETLKQQEGASDAPMEKDTVVYFKDMPEADELSADERKLIENAAVKMTMSEKKQQMLVNIEIPFANIEDMNKISKVMEKVGADQQMGGMSLGGGVMSGSTALFALKKKTLSRLPAPKPESKDADESMEMMKMFLGEAKYKTIYHLPGKVKKADIPGATVDGNMVTVTNSLLDIIDGKVKIEGDIKFK